MKRRSSSSSRTLGAATGPAGGTYRGRHAQTPSPSNVDLSAEAIDMVVSPDGVAVVPADKSTHFKTGTLFRGAFIAMREIVWDYRNKMVAFIMADGRVSGPFIITALRQLEVQISAALMAADVNRQPKQAYIGVLVGQIPSTPIQQRRSAYVSLNVGVASLTGRASDQLAQSMVLTGTKRRELLEQERPLRNATSRERLAIDFFRTGYLSFSCSIARDRRGLKLDAFFLSVFPSPDCHDRSACLFSYPYDTLESCRAVQSRLEFRFKRAEGSGAVKQPTYFVFQSREAQLIREAVWYLKNGTFREASTRERAIKVAQATVSDPTATNPSGTEDATSSQRDRALTCDAEEGSLDQHIDSRCRMIGCQRQCESSPSCRSSSSNLSDSSTPSVVLMNNTPVSHDASHTAASTAPTSTRAASSATIRAGIGCLCNEHASMLCGSPPTGANKLKHGGSSGFFSHKERSSRTIAHAMVPLVQAGHFARTLKYHGWLLKRPGSGGGSSKYQVKKSWNQKVAVVIETPVGGFLCYYDKLSHCPGMTDTPKERRVIDLSSVLCIRAESLFCAPSGSTTSNGAGGQSAGSYAFDIITLYRTWTFAATDAKEYEAWIHVLTELVEKHAAAAPDRPMRYPVKVALSTNATRPTTRTEEAVLEISAHGLCVLNPTSSGGNPANGVDNDGGGPVQLTWYFTAIQKWSVVAHQGEKCCLLSCLAPVEKEAALSSQRPSLPSALSAPALPTSPQASGASSGSGRCESFLFQTAEAGAICDVIEFYVGKCMAKLEVLTIECMERYAREREIMGTEGVTPASLMASMLTSTQQKPVERSRSEKIVTKSATGEADRPPVPLSKLYASGPKSKEAIDTKEHPVRAVLLAPIAPPSALLPALSGIPTNIRSTSPLPTSQADISAPARVEETANDAPLLNKSLMTRDSIARPAVDPTPTEVSCPSQDKTRSPVAASMEVDSEVAGDHGAVPEESVGDLAVANGSLPQPIELDMIECVLEVDDGEDAGEELGLFPVDDLETDVPLLEHSLSHSELQLDECDASQSIRAKPLDLSCLTINLADFSGAREDNDGVSGRDGAVVDAEEEDSDRFESFDYFICHVDGVVAPAVADSADGLAHA